MLRELEAARRELTRISRALTEIRKHGKRTCSQCKELRRPDEFYRGHRSQCKYCMNAKRRAHRLKNLERERAYNKAYSSAKWERIKADPVLLERKRAYERELRERKKQVA